jgi:hypothetical protein
MVGRRPCPKLPDRAGQRERRESMVGRREVMARRGQPRDLGHNMAEVGQGEAKVADLVLRVRRGLGFMLGPKELREQERGRETDRAKPYPQGRRAHSSNPAWPMIVEP